MDYRVLADRRKVKDVRYGKYYAVPASNRSTLKCTSTILRHSEKFNTITTKNGNPKTATDGILT